MQIFKYHEFVGLAEGYELNPYLGCGDDGWIGYGDLDTYNWKSPYRLVEVPYVTHGDYVGSLVDRVNFKWIKKNFGDLFGKGIFPYNAHYRTKGMVYDLDVLQTAVDIDPDVYDTLSDEARNLVDRWQAFNDEVLQALESYPLLDEEKYSNLQYKMLYKDMRDSTGVLWDMLWSELDIDKPTKKQKLWAYEWMWEHVQEFIDENAFYVVPYFDKDADIVADFLEAFTATCTVCGIEFRKNKPRKKSRREYCKAHKAAKKAQLNLL